MRTGQRVPQSHIYRGERPADQALRPELPGVDDLGRLQNGLGLVLLEVALVLELEHALRARAGVARSDDVPDERSRRVFALT